MGQPKPPTTEIKPQDPLIVQESVRPSTLYGQGKFLESTTENLNRALAMRSASADALLGRPTTPILRDNGEAIPTNLGFTQFDPTVFFEASKNPYLAADIAETKRKEERANRMERRRERMDQDMNNIFGMDRASYLNALGRISNQGRST